MIEYRHFKRADGTLFGKKSSVTAAQIAAYLKDGCIEVDVNGESLDKPKKTPKKDDKE